MKKSDDQVIDINATGKQLGDKYIQVLAVHALNGCATTRYLFGKSHASAIAILLRHEVKLEALGKIDANICDVIITGHKYFSTMYAGN